MKLVTVTPAYKSKRAFSFKVQAPQSPPMQFGALTKFDMDQWVQVLADHNQREILGVSAEDEEDSPWVCADCGAQHATWCSLNLGVTICLKCSGVHRRLSTAISRVRSLTLDAVHASVVRMLDVLTNKAANTILLSRTPDAKAPPGDDAGRSSFITRKYQAKEFADIGEPPSPFEAIRSCDPFGLFHAMNFGRAGDVDSGGLTPIHAAVQSGNTILAAVAACGSPDVDLLDAAGWTPLGHAVYGGFIEIARMLVSLNAKPERCQHEGLLEMAIDMGVGEVLNVGGKTRPLGTTDVSISIEASEFAQNWPRSIVPSQEAREVAGYARMAFG